MISLFRLTKYIIEDFKIVNFFKKKDCDECTIQFNFLIFSKKTISK